MIKCIGYAVVDKEGELSSDIYKEVGDVPPVEYIDCILRSYAPHQIARVLIEVEDKNEQ